MYDPFASHYAEEAACRDEMTRTLNVCLSCQRCVNKCSVFPQLFDRLDELDTADAGDLVPVDQDGLVESCNLGGDCLDGCPMPSAVNVPDLMLRMQTMRRQSGHLRRPLVKRLAALRHADAGCPHGKFVAQTGQTLGSCGQNAALGGDIGWFRNTAIRTITEIADALGRGETVTAPHHSCMAMLLDRAPAAGVAVTEQTRAIIRGGVVVHRETCQRDLNALNARPQPTLFFPSNCSGCRLLSVRCQLTRNLTMNSSGEC